MRQSGSAAKQSGINDEAVTPSKSMLSRKKKETPSPLQPTIDSVFPKTPAKTPDKKTYKTPDKKISVKKIRQKGD